MAWQTLAANWGDTKRRPPDYHRYLRMHGLAPEQDKLRRKRRPVTDQDRQAVAHVEQLIRDYRGPMMRSAAPS